MPARGARGDASEAARSAVVRVRSAASGVAAGQLLEELNRPELALEAYRRAALTEPDAPDPHGLMGVLLGSLGRNLEAVEALEAAMQRTPGDQRARAIYAESLIRAGRAADAADVMVEGERLAPNDPDVHLVAGRAHWAASAPDAAIAAYRRAHTAGPNRLDCALALGTALARNDEPAEAYELLHALLDRFPDAPELLVNAGLAAAETGDVEAGIRLMHEALRLRPEVASLHCNLGGLLFRREDYEAATAAFRTAVQLDPDLPEAHLRLAYAQRARHARDAALHSAQRAIDAAEAGSEVAERATRLVAELSALPDVAVQSITTSADSDVTAALSGNLSSIPLTNVLEFLRNGRSTGSLLLSSERGVGDVRLADGALLAAAASMAPRLGDLLVDRGAIDRGSLTRLISLQRARTPPPPLGALAVELGLLTPEALRASVTAHIGSALEELLTWKTGSFSFQPFSTDEIVRGPGSVSLRLDHAIIDALRRIDERSQG